MTAIAAVDIERLAKVCGLFGSEHGGERASAALKAHNLVHGAGLTWPDVLGGLIVDTVNNRSVTTGDTKPQRDWHRNLSPAWILATYGAGLSAWERCFLGGLAKRAPGAWTDRQREALADIQGRFK